jgi:MazG family protein
MNTTPIEQVRDIMRKLRDPGGGCPWDREQDLESLKPFLIEECYELIDAIDSADARKHKEELGDMLLQVIFQTQLREEKGEFTFEDICNTLSEKLIRRHPHVFADVKVTGSKDVLTK